MRGGGGALRGFNLLVLSLYRKASFDSGREGLWNRKEKLYVFLTAAVSFELLYGVTVSDLTAGRGIFVGEEHLGNTFVLCRRIYCLWVCYFQRF